MKIRSIAVGAAAAAAALAATLAPHPNATASVHPAARWSATWASAMQPPVPGNGTTGPEADVGRLRGPDGPAGHPGQQRRQPGAGPAIEPVRHQAAAGDRGHHRQDARRRHGRTGDGAVADLPRGALRDDPAGRVAASDPAAWPIAPLESLTITLFFAGSTGPSTFHEDGLTASYRAAGDHRFDSGAAAFGNERSHSFYYLTGVDVTGGRPGTRS